MRVSDSGPDEKSIYIDANTRIQVLDTMLLLPHAEKEQRAAFIVRMLIPHRRCALTPPPVPRQRDERVIVVWSYDLDDIIPTCKYFEDRLIKLLWCSRPPAYAVTASTETTSYPSTASGSVSGHAGDMSSGDHVPADEKLMVSGRVTDGKRVSISGNRLLSRDLEKGGDDIEDGVSEKGGKGWFGKRRVKKGDDRPVRLFAPVYNGLATALSICGYSC